MAKTAPLKRSVLAAYAVPTFGEQMMLAPVWGILPALYVENTKVTLTAIGGVFMFARLFDAVSDPLIGYLSDITKSKYGPRKPWIAAGAIFSAISVWFLYTPSPDAGAVYFLITSSCLFLGWTMMTIPYNAWAAELTGDYQERARLFAFRNAFGTAGGMLFVLSPLFLERWTGNTEFTLDLMRLLAMFLLIFLPVSVGFALVKAPQGTSSAIDLPSLKGLAVSLKKNRVLWLFATITLLGGTVQGIFVSLLFLYQSAYLGLGEYVPYLGAVMFIVQMISIPFWLQVVKKYGKHRPWAFSSFGFVIVAPILFFVQPGEGALIPLFFAMGVYGLLNAAIAVSPQSMLTDVIDLDTLKTGVNRAGNYFSLLTLLSKGTTAIGSGIGLAAAGLVGFNPQGGSTQTAIFGFLIVFTGVPLIVNIINGFLILKYPLDERRQTIIRKRIEQRAARAESAAL